MKFTTALYAIVGLAALGSAQLEDLPACSLQCFYDNMQYDGCATLDDYKCHCERTAELRPKIDDCVKESCSKEDVKKTADAVEKKCREVGVEVDVPGN